MEGTILAKATYDNIAETKDELEFHRGDIVTVLEQNTAGLEGWWLCSFGGRQGIAPGNRLMLLPAMYGGRQRQASEDTYDVPPSHSWMSKPGDNGQEEEYDVPRRQLQISYNNASQSIDSPTEVYDVPRASAWGAAQVNVEDEVYDIPPVAVPLNSSIDELQDVYNVPNSLSAAPDPRELYDVPPLVSRDPQRKLYHPEDVYDVPPRRAEQPSSSEMISVQDPSELYDVPLSSLRQDIRSREFSSFRQESTESDVVYDIPQSNKMVSERRIISSGLSSLRRMRKEMKESKKSPDDGVNESRNPEYVYDVPPQVTRDLNQSSSQPSADDVVDSLLERLSISSAPNDTNLRSHRMSTASRDSYNSYIDDNPSQYNELNVCLDEALHQVITLKQSLEDAVSHLLTLVKENWRKLENISGKTLDVQKSFLEVLVAVNKFIVYARGATANACFTKDNNSQEKRAPKEIQMGLRRLLIPLEEDLEMLKRALGELDECQWDVKKLAVDTNNEDGTILDEVDSFVMTSRAVSDDAAQMAIYVHTHAVYIFKKSVEPNTDTTPSANAEVVTRPVQEIQALQARPLPAVPPTQNVSAQPNVSAMSVDRDGLLDDYDYVALPGKEELPENKKETKNNQNPISGLNKRKTQLLALEKEIAQPRTAVYILTPQDKDALKNLELDIPDLIRCLSQAIDRFINAIDSGKPPHSFVALGKHVILCAHKLVFVGDCIHQHISQNLAKTAIQEQCGSMCSVLKRTVVIIKLAALQWPSVTAVQDMVDKMFEIATCAHQMRLTFSNITSGV